jgi:hypothetical protein
MSTETRDLTLDQYRAIEWHTNEMIAACLSALSKLRQIPVTQRGPQIVNQVTYYKNAIGGFKWSLGLAKHRCPAARNV